MTDKPSVEIEENAAAPVDRIEHNKGEVASRNIQVAPNTSKAKAKTTYIEGDEAAPEQEVLQFETKAEAPVYTKEELELQKLAAEAGQKKSLEAKAKKLKLQLLTRPKAGSISYREN